MKALSFLLVITAAIPAHASEAALYKRLMALDPMKNAFVVERTPTGVDFAGKEKVHLAGSSAKHSQFHIEVEGPMPAHGAASLQASVELVARVISSEVDRKHTESNAIYPGLGVDIVDVNGTHVAFLQYKSAREPDTYMRRAVIYAAGNIYTVTMALHSTQENDQMGMYLPMLVIEMVNSNEIPGLRP
jgi:hypothetical protein